MTPVRESSYASAQFARDALQPPEAAPPLAVRYFYTSPLAIDDPLSPLPPPLTGSSASYRSAPRPFSTYDNAAIEKAWLDSRRKLLDGAGQQSRDISRSRQGTVSSRSTSRPHSLAAQPQAINQGKRRSLGESFGSPRISGSPRAAGSPRPSPQRIPSAEDITGIKITRNERLKAGENPSNALRILDPADSSVPSEPASITRTPFIRAPSRSNVRDAIRPASSTRPTPQLTDSYNWGEDYAATEEMEGQPRVRESVSSKRSGPSTNIQVGVSRLHRVAIPELQ